MSGSGHERTFDNSALSACNQSESDIERFLLAVKFIAKSDLQRTF